MPSITFEEIVGEIEEVQSQAAKEKGRSRPVELKKVEATVRQVLESEAWRAERLCAD